jgi:tetratricopeptide (TPR) repeat protein
MASARAKGGRCRTAFGSIGQAFGYVAAVLCGLVLTAQCCAGGDDQPAPSAETTPTPPGAEAAPASPADPLRAERLAECDRLSDEAMGLYRDGDYAAAEERARDILAIEQDVLGDDDPELIGTLDFIAACQTAREAWDEARRTYEQIVERSIAVYGAEDYRVVDARLAREEVALLQALTPAQRAELSESDALIREVVQLNGEGRYAEATTPAERALQIRRNLLGEWHPAYARSLNNLAVLHNAQADYARAEPLYRQASEIWKAALGERHPHYAASLNNLALLYDDQGDYARAEPLYRQASEIWKDALGERHPHYAASLNNLAFLYFDQGDYARAEPLFRQALEIRRAVLGERHPDYAASLNNLAALHNVQADHARAEPLYREASEIWKDALGARHPD